MDNYNSRAERSCHCQSPVGFFAETLAAVREQIEVGSMPPQDKALASEIALIITELIHLSPESDVSIGRDKLSASLVTEIYKRLNGDHVRAVIHRFRKANYKITHTKAYLRTALYNSVFELEAQTENEVAVDMPYLYEGGA